MTPVFRRDSLVSSVAGLVAIVVLCLMAQVQFLAGSAAGYIWLGAAGLVSLAVILPGQRPDLVVLDPGPLDIARGRRRQLGLLLLIVAIVLLARSGWSFHNQFRVTTNITASVADSVWIQYLTGLALALAGGLVLMGVGRVRVHRKHLLVVLAIFALAVFLRVYQLGQYPFGIWYDEAIYGLDVRRVLRDSGFRPFYGDNITFPHLALFTLGIKVFGVSNIVGLRAISALLASVGVCFAYLVGRELRGARFGIAMAFLLAVMRWSINFSRIGMTGAEVPTFVLAALYCAIRLARYERLRDALWFGVALAAGIYFYRAYLVQTIAVAVYLLLAYPFLRRAWKRTLALALTALLAAFVVLIPVGIFALERPDDYWGRVDKTSIYNEGLADVNAAIVESTVKHLEMFHLRGDRNGRHNLPGEPMLDPVMGSLAVIGLFLALRGRRPEHPAFVASFALALTGGIFSLSFEAPQSLRVIGVITPVVYFTALGLDGLVRTVAAALQTRLPPGRSSLARGGAPFAAVALLIPLCAWNVTTYFGRQRNNLDVWRSFSTQETLAARFLARYDETTRFFISPLIGISPQSSFLAEQASRRATSLVMPDPLPLRVAGTSRAVVMLLPAEQNYVDYMRRIYPDATYTPVRPADYGVETDPERSLFTVVDLSPADIGSIQGLRAGEGVFYAPSYETYTFSFGSAASVQIDGARLTDGASVLLAEGNHRLVVEPPNAAVNWRYSAAPNGEPIPTQFLYHDPVTFNGLHASLYAGPNWEGQPAAERIVPFVSQYIHIIPMARPYSVRYSGYLYAPATGDYEFRLEARDTGALEIDGADVARAAPENPGNAKVALKAGWHSIEVRHQDLTHSTSIYLSWKPPGAEALEMLPRDFLCPGSELCRTPHP